MFGLPPKNEPTKLDVAIMRLLEEMETYGPDSPEYPKMLSYLEKLNTVKTQTRRNKVDANTIAIVAGNLFGILIIVAYEQKNVMASKAVGFILKPK